VSAETKQDFEAVRDLMSGKFPEGATIEQVFQTLLASYLERHDPGKRHERREKRLTSRKAKEARASILDQIRSDPPASAEGQEAMPVPIESRHVPAALRDEIHVRDEGQCTYVGPDGRRCEARRCLAIDHRRPFALGGDTSAENCGLLCRAHNQLVAAEIFGVERIERAIEARRGRTQARPIRISTGGDEFSGLPDDSISTERNG
jgi:hypothetical protein